MAFVLKDFSTVKREMQDDLNALLPQASQASNSAVLDLCINPSATQISFLYRVLNQIVNTTQLSTVSGSDLDRYAANYGVTRNPGTLAQGSVFLSLDSSIENGNNITIANGSIVSASTSTGSTSFIIVGDQLIRAADKEQYAAIAQTNYDSLVQGGINNAKYVVEVPIQATAPGPTGLIGTYGITGGNLVGVSEIINLQPTSGGFAEESDESLRQRVGLVIAGNSVGTIPGIRSSALEVVGTSSAFTVVSGDPLMTRDGTVVDPATGAIIKQGRGNAIDVYIFGDLSSDATENYVFTEDLSTVENISLKENTVLGSANSAGTGVNLQPVSSVGSIVGSVSGANFTLATEVTDSDGNVILDGHVALIKDFQASEYFLVRDNTTNELVIARNLNPTSSRYSIISQLQPSPFANSNKGQDSLIFLRKKAIIKNEPVVRGTKLNGVDPLRYTNVTDLTSITENVQITREIIVVGDNGSSRIQTRHAPILDVSKVTHVRLGTQFTPTIADATAGLIDLSGRFVPQAGDLLEVSYVWQKSYLKGFEFDLLSDSVNWINPDFEIESDSLTVYNGDIGPSLTLQYQPLTPSYLQLTLANAVSRATYTAVVTGEIADVYQGFLTSYQPGLVVGNDPNGIVFNNALISRDGSIGSYIGRIVRVSNVTKGFDYNLLGYSLLNNKADPAANINRSLANTQFSLSFQTNNTIIATGDYLRFNAPKSHANWNSASELENNIRSNLKPTYDATALQIDPSGEIQLLQLETNTNLPLTVAPTTITQDTTWSGFVRVDKNVIVNKGIVLTISPGTIVSFVASKDLPAVQEVRQRVIIDKLSNNSNQLPIINPNWAKQFFLYSNGTGVPYFVVISSSGQEELSIKYNTDWVAKVKTDDLTLHPLGFSYLINGYEVDPKFDVALGQITNANVSVNSSTLFCTVHQESTISGPLIDIYTVYNISRFGVTNYLVPLENIPRTLSEVEYDIQLIDAPTRTKTRAVSYEPTQGKMAIVTPLAEENVEWNLEYGILYINRTNIIVRGTLIADGLVAETPIVFTSYTSVQAPGDWSGIVFEETSSSIRTTTGLRSSIRYCIFKQADIPFQIIDSDPLIEKNIIKNYASAGGVSRGSTSTLTKYTPTNFTIQDLMFASNVPQRIRRKGTEGIPSHVAIVSTLTPSGYGTCGYGYGYCGYGYNGCEGTSQESGEIVSSAYISYAIPIKPLTASGVVTDGEIPNFIAITDNRAIVDLTYNLDYTLFIDDKDITSYVIETFQDCSSITLIPGIDFNIELDLDTVATYIVFYNTMNMQAFLYLYAQQARKFAITIRGSVNDVIINDNVFLNSTNPAWIAEFGSAVKFTNNSVFRSGTSSLHFSNSYVDFRNNIVTEYSSVPVVKDSKSLVFARRNNLYSTIVMAYEPYLPINTDQLAKDLLIDATVIPTNDRFLYKVGQLLQIGQEFLKVIQVGQSVRVVRAQFASAAITHPVGAPILIIKDKFFFSITGVPSKKVSLILVDSRGNPLNTFIPVVMNQVTEGTFRIAIPVDRNNTVKYRYRFWDTSPEIFVQTQVFTIDTTQFGNAVNDFYSSSTSSLVIESGNYSVDPKFVNPTGENFELQNDSTANLLNPIYATPYDPSVPYNRYIGLIPRVETQYLTEHTKIIKLNFPLLASSTLVESVKITHTITGKRLYPSSFNSETNEITITNAVSLKNVGQYLIEYNSPISLGSSLIGNPQQGIITYQFDAKRSVQFTGFRIEKDTVGGVIQLSYRTAPQQDELTNQTFSPFIRIENDEVDFSSLNIVGSIIEFQLQLQGNDGSFNSNGQYLYPRLQGFTLDYSPQLDSQVYIVKQVQYQSKASKTRIILDPLNAVSGTGITSTTASNLANLEQISLHIQKKNGTGYFELARIGGFVAGDKYIDALGNFTIQRAAPTIDEVITTDIVYLSQGVSETVTFVNASSQITTNRFVGVDNISVGYVLDRVSQQPGNEIFSVDILNQPSSGSTYQTTYSYEAPRDGETLSVSFVYNTLITNVQNNINLKKDVLADILVRQMFGIKVNIAANVVLVAGSSVPATITQITQAISSQLNALIAQNPNGGGRIDAVDTLALIKSISSVDDVVLLSHHREGYTGVTNIGFSTREYPILDTTSPEITVVSQAAPNTPLSIIA